MAVSLLLRSSFRIPTKQGVLAINKAFIRCFYVGSLGRNNIDPPFDRKLLEILVCPLSKKPLRYDGTTNELISDEIGVAYSVQNGIPNLIPHDGRLLKKDTAPSNDKDDCKNT